MHSRIPGRAIACLAFLLASVSGHTENGGDKFRRSPPDPDLAYHEQTLKGAGVTTNSAGLLGFFRARTSSSEERARLAACVRQLGARSFAVRQKAEQSLARAGRLALPLLRPATKDPDIEIVRRAERVIAEIERNPDAVLVVSAARLLTVRRPVGAVEALLAYLPAANDEAAIDAVRTALAAIGVRGGKADRALLAALKDTEPARRTAAALAVGQATPEQRKAVRPLLTDRDVSVRFAAATALVRAGDREALPSLLALLTDAPPELAGQAEDLLYQIAGNRAPPAIVTGDAVARRKCRAAWEAWWKANAKMVDWNRLTLETPLLGLTLVCEAHLPDGGRVFECAADGKPRWTVRVQNPIDAQLLPGNRILVADSSSGRVVELNRDGKELWRYACSSPVAVQRLPNGNTLIGTYTEVMEVTRAGKKLYGYPRNQAGSLYYARKQRNGHIVCVHSNGILAELDAGGREVLSLNVGGFGKWGGVEVLSGGRFLLARSGADEVAEIDRTGKVLWKVSVRNPNSAVRLRNGNTLVASHDDNCVYEFNRAGKEVWKRKVVGHPFRARRR